MTIRNPVQGNIDSLKIINQYVEALADSNFQAMSALRSEDCVLDLVTQDAFGAEPLNCSETTDFWKSWFEAFPEMDYQVTRTIAAENVVVTQWTFTGTNSGPIPPILDSQSGPTGKTIRLRGASIYDLSGGLIQRETNYMDLGTLLVELGIQL